MAMSENRPEQTGRRAPRTAFKPGQSGNPGGRPRELKDVQEAAREHTTAAIQRLAYWMQSDNPKASPAAAQALLDRGCNARQALYKAIGDALRHTRSNIKA
jgi:hypothetical protein